MANIDLVPEEYRYWTWQLRFLKRSGLALACLLVASASLWVYLHIEQQNTAEDLRLLQNRKNVSENQQKRLEFLSSEQKQLQQQWTLLNGLRGGATVERLFEVIDQALDGDSVWFKEWRFLRAGQTLQERQVAPERSRGSYIIILSDEENSTPETPSAWAIKTHLNISGGAEDHSALSAFVERLLSHARISEVKVLNTSLYSSRSDSQAINFSMSILVNNALEAES